MELNDLQMMNMIAIAIGLIGINIFVIKSKKMQKKSKLTVTLCLTFSAYAICALIDANVYSSIPDVLTALY